MKTTHSKKKSVLLWIGLLMPAVFIVLLLTGFFEEYQQAAFIYTNPYFRIFCIAICVAIELALIAWRQAWKLPLGPRLDKLSMVISPLLLIAVSVLLGDALATQINIRYSQQQGKYSRFYTMQIVEKQQAYSKISGEIYYLFLKDQYNRNNKIKVSQSLYERVKTEGWLQFRYSISKTGYYLKPRYIWVLNEKLE